MLNSLKENAKKCLSPNLQEKIKTSNIPERLKQKIQNPDGTIDEVALILLQEFKQLMLKENKIEGNYKYYKQKYFLSQEEVLDGLMTLHGLNLIRGCEYFFFHKKDDEGKRDLERFYFVPNMNEIQSLFSQ